MIANNAKYVLDLDLDEFCGRECDHKGWQILDGKILDGHIPPDIIMPYSTGRFSISGRDSSAVAPKGTIYIADSKTFRFGKSSRFLRRPQKLAKSSPSI